MYKRLAFVVIVLFALACNGNRTDKRATSSKNKSIDTLRYLEQIAVAQIFNIENGNSSLLIIPLNKLFEFIPVGHAQEIAADKQFNTYKLKLSVSADAYRKLDGWKVDTTDIMLQNLSKHSLKNLLDEYSEPGNRNRVLCTGQIESANNVLYTLVAKHGIKLFLDDETGCIVISGRM